MKGDQWQQAMIERLAASKRLDVPFWVAWQQAIRYCPPPRQEAPATLFDDEGRRPETLTGFFQRACEHAYLDVQGPPGSGDGPALRGFRADMLQLLDADAPARGLAA